MILVDSSVWIDYFNGIESKQTNTLDKALGSEIVLIGDIILTEVLQGFSKDKDYETARHFFDNIKCFDMVGKDIALKSAENYGNLRKHGVTVRKTIDVIIGTFCIENDLMLLHADRDFDPLENHLGLKIYR